MTKFIKDQNASIRPTGPKTHKPEWMRSYSNFITGKPRAMNMRTIGPQMSAADNFKVNGEVGDENTQENFFEEYFTMNERIPTAPNQFGYDRKEKSGKEDTKL